MSITSKVEQQLEQQLEHIPTHTNTNTNTNTNTDASNFKIIPSIDKEMDTLMLDDIASFKKSTLQWAKSKLADEGSLLETKEVKNLVSIVDTIEKSVKPKEEANTTVVNVLVQNLMEAKDDC